MSSAARRLLLLPVCALLMAATALVEPRPVQGPTDLTVKERMIHRKYAGWMQNFSVALSQDFQRAISEKISPS
jgi:outer membrane biogenesis lipoprotein LolB